MEKYAYDYAVSMNYDIPRHEGDPTRMHMSDLFDMITGTSIGAI